MRIGMMILSILCMLGGAGLGILSTDQGFGENAAKYEKSYEQAKKLLGEDNELTKKAETIVSGYKKSSIAGVLIALLSIAGVVLMFLKKEKPLTIAAGASLAVTVLFILLSPAFDTGSSGPAPPRTQVMIFGIPGTLACIFALLSEKARAKKANA